MKKGMAALIVVGSGCLYLYLTYYLLKNNKPHYTSKLESQPNTKIVVSKPDVLLFIGVVSAPRHKARRDAVRRSWLSLCKNHKIPCWIFTDGQDVNGTRISNTTHAPLKQEQDQHGDLILTQSPGGINFALRYLWIIQWASERYNFQFLLRVDDDYFVCLDRLFLELPHRPQEKLYWGWLHCDIRGPAIDEGFIILSKDLVKGFLQQLNHSLMCLPYGGATIALWINDVKEKVNYFGDNRRLLHRIGKDVSDKIIGKYQDLCGSLLGIHRSYPVEMDKYWHRYISTNRPGRNYSIEPMRYPCNRPQKSFNHRLAGKLAGFLKLTLVKTNRYSVLRLLFQEEDKTVNFLDAKTIFVCPAM